MARAFPGIAKGSGVVWGMLDIQGLTIEIRTGPPPSRLDAADIGTLLGKAGLPPDEGRGTQRHATVVARIVAHGIAGHFRLKDDGDRCIDQGTIGRFGDGADMVLDKLQFHIDESVTVTPRLRRQ